MENIIIPSHILIETVEGICNNRCIMCPIESSIRKGIMDNKTFAKILNKLQPFLDHQQFLSFCGLGETLLDRNTPDKIKFAKQLGFQGIGIYTNGLTLDEKMSRQLLDAGLDTLIISIDGFTSKVHEAIRLGSNLTKVVSNLEQFILLRNTGDYKTKIIIRFNKQELNQHEENDFCNFWKTKINKDRNDAVIVYNIHNVGGWGLDKLDNEMLNKMKGLKCPEIYERCMIGSDGSIVFCCGDQFGFYNIGNIFEDGLIQLYNSPRYVEYREAMNQGRILDLELCKNCSVAYSIATRAIKQ